MSIIYEALKKVKKEESAVNSQASKVNKTRLAIYGMVVLIVSVAWFSYKVFFEKTKTAKIRKDLLEGADFAETARKQSDCPSKTQGGDLGTFKRGSMVKPFEDAAFSQKTNEIGPIVKTRFGYHIIQVLEHKQAAVTSLNDAKKEITEKLIQKEKEKAVHQYLTQLRNKAKIVYGKTEKK